MFRRQFKVWNYDKLKLHWKRERGFFQIFRVHDILNYEYFLNTYAYALFDRVIAFHPNVWSLKHPESWKHESWINQSESLDTVTVWWENWSKPWKSKHLLQLRIPRNLLSTGQFHKLLRKSQLKHDRSILEWSWKQQFSGWQIRPSLSYPKARRQRNSERSTRSLKSPSAKLRTTKCWERFHAFALHTRDTTHTMRTIFFSEAFGEASEIGAWCSEPAVQCQRWIRPELVHQPPLGIHPKKVLWVGLEAAKTCKMTEDLSVSLMEKSPNTLSRAAIQTIHEGNVWSTLRYTPEN